MIEFLTRSSPVAKGIKNLALSQQWLGLLLWRRFNPWPGNLKGHVTKKKKKTQKNKEDFLTENSI